MRVIRHLRYWYQAYRFLAEAIHKKYEKDENAARKLYIELKKKKFSPFTERLLGDNIMGLQKGLDPIQLFAIFNFPRMITERRISIVNLLLEEFDIYMRVDKNTSFEGCPTPIIAQIVKFREPAFQKEIWRLFHNVMNKNIEGFTRRDFKSLNRWRGLDIASLTIFFFWIDSERFLPMDKNTVKLLRLLKLIESRPRVYEQYYGLCTGLYQQLEQKNVHEDAFRSLVKDAGEINETNFKVDFLSPKSRDVIQEVIRQGRSGMEWEKVAKTQIKSEEYGFQIIALRPTAKQGRVRNATGQKHLKNLKEGTLYQFYDAYVFDEQKDNIILFNPGIEMSLYKQDKLSISISSIVGKNGSGKSTIAEFLFLIINKIAYAKKIKSTEKLVNEEVYADLFIRSDKIYKFSVGTTLSLYEYEIDDDNKTYRLVTQEKDAQEQFAGFDLERFCYSIVLNYSLYGLNSAILGEWINPLFHKNDSYQVPIALNPLRNEGIIDVNNEEFLTRSRLLSNLLEPELFGENERAEELVPGAVPKILEITFDKAKLTRKKERYLKKYGTKPSKKNVDLVMKAVGITVRPKIALAAEATEYIYYKVVAIGDWYPQFKKYRKLPEWIENTDKLFEFINVLQQDLSHITIKLRQAINFLKFCLYKKAGQYNIYDLSKSIKDVQSVYDQATIELTPPSFFQIDIEFRHGGRFNDLSSGEKQQIFSINSLAYHIYNISSVMYRADTYKYTNINIICDEIELCFHPEMQKTYVNNLLNRISDLKVSDSISSINIIFITHSPFILSDIPATNILKLKVDHACKSNPVKSLDSTFGANIHDLLANDFFLENGYMGKFANDRINEIINKIESWEENNETPKADHEKDELFNTIQLIGEPLLKESLIDLYREKIGLHPSEYSIVQIDEQIERLNRLKDNIYDNNTHSNRR